VSAPDPVASLIANRDAILSRITAACERAGRDPREVELIWVSKTHPVETLVAAHGAGARLFGENRVQEALAKTRRNGGTA
jgi:PLP dependent protein